MKKFLKWFGIVIVALVILGAAAFQVMKHNTKKNSPERVTRYQENGYDIEIVYSAPFKKNRTVFGELVPYGEVWRTGANEATTFTTGTDLIIDGQTLPKGKYTLWTIPNERTWDVIFNSGSYGWGIGMGGQSPRKPELDVVKLTAPVQRNFKVMEQFFIDVDGDPLLMKIGWDFTRVDVPLSKNS